jgi:type I restriction enzyme S subunit
MSWDIVSIDDICTEITDGTHYTPTYTSMGIPFLSVKDLTNGSISFADCRYISEEEHSKLTKRCKPEKGDVLYTKVGTTGVAKAVDIDDDFSIFVSVALLKLKQNMFPKFIELSLNSEFTRKQAEHLTQGAANRNLVLKDLRRITLFCTSYDEQRRITAEIERQFAIVEKAKQAATEQLAAAQSLNAAFLRDVFEGNEWKRIPLGELCERIYSGGTPRTTVKEYFNGDIPWVTSKDMKFDVISDSQIRITKKAVAESSAKLVPQYSMLMVVRSGILKHSLPVAVNSVEIAINQDLKAFIPKKNINAFYLKNAVTAYASELLKNVRATTADNIEMDIVKGLEIPVPPLETQKQISKQIEVYYEKANKMITAIQSQLDTIAAMPAAILRQAFRGQI